MSMTVLPDGFVTQFSNVSSQELEQTGTIL